ncbi:MAG: GDSL-type esterase/lipase family protein [Candidatus Limimorpha sp.]
MKPTKTLLFIFSVIALLGIAWLLFPSDGVRAGSLTLRFPSYAEARMGEEKTLDVDSVLNTVSQSFEMTCSDNALDSLEFFRIFLTMNPNRIYLPHDDYTFFDSIFSLFEHARARGKTYRILHYGDSQIEMDRITSILRQRIQEIFGGSGPNMIPAIQTIPSISISQRASGDLTRYTLYGDSTTRRASHKRYGVMTQFSQAHSYGTISFSKTSHSQAQDNVKNISRVALLLGNTGPNFSATLQCDKLQSMKRTQEASNGAALVTWELPCNVKRGSITTNGRAEIYAVLLDGGPGVCVDNIPLRGCSGTVFTRIDKKIMAQSLQLLNTRLIILQFGGNRMPGIRSSKNIVNYLAELERQIAFFKEIAPQAKMLFIGPSDMSRSYNGKMQTWKNLPELNDSLKAMALRNNLAYWDLFHVMGGEGSMAQYVKHNPALAGPDYIHFTFTGAQKIGTTLAKSLTTYYDFYKLRQHLPNDSVIDFIRNKSNDRDTHLIQQLSPINPYLPQHLQ